MKVKEAAKWAVGGACTGICVMVAAPVLAPMGVITAAGAAIGAVGGGLAGGIFGAVKPSPDEKKAHAEQREAEAKEKAAQYAIKIKKLSDALKRQGGRLQGWAEFEKFIVAFTAIGFSIAEQNGELRDDLRQTIEEFVARLGKNVLPPHIKARIAEYAEAPPNFATARGLYALLDSEFSDRQWREIVDGLIDVLAEHPSADSALVAAWNAAWREELKRAEARRLPWAAGTARRA